MTSVIVTKDRIQSLGRRDWVPPWHPAGHSGSDAFPTVPNALYDLEADPGETTDVSSVHPAITARLDVLADSIRAALGDELTGVRGREVRESGRRRFPRADSIIHSGVGSTVTVSVPPAVAYDAGGEGGVSLTDGLFGSQDTRDGRWLGCQGHDVEIRLDLGKTDR